jgi:DNA-binding response OmpR family regulator
MLRSPTQAPSPSGKSIGEQRRFWHYGDLTVDLLQHIIILDGHLLELTPTEFELLAHLIKQAPRIVSSKELVQEVQGYDSEHWEARETIRSHIYHIRRKIKEVAGEQDVIRTVRGVGYTIKE